MFFKLVATNADTIFAAVYPPPKGAGELVFGDASIDPLPACLEAFPGQEDANQLRLRPLEEKEVRWGDNQQIWRVGDRLEACCRQGLLDRGGDFGFVCFVPTVLGQESVSFQLENRQGLSQILLDVCSGNVSSLVVVTATTMS